MGHNFKADRNGGLDALTPTTTVEMMAATLAQFRKGIREVDTAFNIETVITANVADTRGKTSIDKITKIKPVDDVGNARNGIRRTTTGTDVEMIEIGMNTWNSEIKEAFGEVFSGNHDASIGSVLYSMEKYPDHWGYRHIDSFIAVQTSNAQHGITRLA